MWLDLIALGLLAYMVFAGFRRGALVSFLRVFSVVTAYAASFWLGPVLAPAAGRWLVIPELAAVALTGTGIFFGVLLLLGGVTALVRRAQRQRDPEHPRHPGDRAAGAFFGALQGASVVLLVGVLSGWIEAGRRTPTLSRLPDPGGHKIAAAAQRTIETAADVMLDDANASARAAARIAARPDRALEDARELLESQSLQRLQRDPLFWSYLEDGSIDRALETASFRGLADDERLRVRLASYGLVDRDAAADPARFRSEMKPVLEHIAPRVRALRSDPALRALANDPRTSEALLSGDTLTLLADPRFRDLLRRFLEPEPSLPAHPD